ncbi:VirD4-like conjugal transfer protein, CD1115 family [Listeria seeligeri]|nr:type IV secretory system conjugative DNA transfer family protein [Listeria seeligeri]MBC1817186.1 type IV secretory system conjugative DNA transfer family protein [Listeria seeligeri]
MKKEIPWKQKLQKKFPINWRESRESAYRNTPHYLANTKVLTILACLFFGFSMFLIQLIYTLIIFTGETLANVIHKKASVEFWDVFFSHILFVAHPWIFLLLSIVIGMAIVFVAMSVYRAYVAMEDFLTAGTNSFETRLGIFETYPLMHSVDAITYYGKPGVPLAHISMEEMEELKEQEKKALQKRKDKITRRAKWWLTHKAQLQLEEELEQIILKEQTLEGYPYSQDLSVLSDKAYEERKQFWLSVGTEITNVVCIGITRSGKKVFFVAPVLDSFSRPKGIYDKASFIVNDTKGELLLENYQMLKDRGYKIRVLNLLKTYQSSAYNPFALVIQAYKKYMDEEGIYTSIERSEALDEAQKLLNSMAYTFYENPDAKEPFWGDNAQLLFVACGLVLVEQGIKTDSEDKITIYSLATLVNEMRGDEILSTDHPFLQNFVTPEKNEEYLFRKYKKQNTLDVFFGELPADHPSKILYASIKAASAASSTIGAIAGHLFSGLKVYLMKGNATLTAMNEFDLEEIGFGEQPVAVFLIIPDQDKSNHALATFFIDQSYKVLIDKAFEVSSVDSKRTCKRPVIYLLDEMGSMPIINDLDNKLTACLGRNIRFFLCLQSFSQLDKYPDGLYDTILSNCGYTFFIKSPSEKTTELVSKRLGKRPVFNLTRQGKFLSLFKSETESVDKEDLLTMTELEQLQFGENVILRIMTNNNLEGEAITAYPILNRGEERFNKHYEYMQTYGEKTWSEIPEVNQGGHTEIELSSLVTRLDPNVIFLDEQRELLENNMMPDIEVDGITPPAIRKEIESIQEKRRETLHVVIQMEAITQACHVYYSSDDYQSMIQLVKKTILRNKVYREVLLSILETSTMENFIECLLSIKSEQQFKKIVRGMHQAEKVA